MRTEQEVNSSWPLNKSETSNEVWISDTHPRCPHRQIEYSIRPGSCGSIRVRLAEERCYLGTTDYHIIIDGFIGQNQLIFAILWFSEVEQVRWYRKWSLICQVTDIGLLQVLTDIWRVDWSFQVARCGWEYQHWRNHDTIIILVNMAQSSSSVRSQ